MRTDNTFGNKLRLQRRKAKMTQSELGKASGLSQQRIAQYESGYRLPRPETVGKIAASLGIDPLELAPSNELNIDSIIDHLMKITYELIAISSLLKEAK